MITINKISNLVFAGGGIGAIAYAGFLAKVERDGILSMETIERIAGVSSGAIAGLQVALNYSAKEILTEMRKTDFKELVEDQHTWLSDIIRLVTEEGFYTQENLYRYIGQLIKAKTGDEFITFHDFHKMKSKYQFKDLYVIATKLFLLNNEPKASPLIFSHEHTPHTRIVDAIRASSALPIIFPPIRLYKTDEGKYRIQANGDLYVDGGMLDAYPINIFDHAKYLKDEGLAKKNHQGIIYNTETLGLKLESPTNIKILEDKNIKKETIITTELQYAEALLYVLKSGQQQVFFAESGNEKRTILIDTLGITSTDFNLTNQQKEALIKSGEKAALEMMNSLQSTNAY